MNKPNLLCPRCGGEDFFEDPTALVVQLYRGMQLEIQTAVMVCRKCEWLAVTGPQMDALMAKAKALYDQVQSGQLQGIKLDRVEETGDVVKCDFCLEVWTERPESGGFIYDNNAYCPSCCQREWDAHHQQWDMKLFLRCPEDTSFADWIRQFRYRTGQTQTRYYSGTRP